MRTFFSFFLLLDCASAADRRGSHSPLQPATRLSDSVHTLPWAELHHAASPSDVGRALKRLKYWATPAAALPASNKYLTFKNDCGGLNNIRIVFEYAVLVASITKRTLVLPPDEAMYLIDWGPIARSDAADKTHPNSSLATFFSMRSLRAGLPVITAKEFIAKEGTRLNAPKGVLHPHLWSPWCSSLG